ncbi:2-hydroxyacid dehydrogenase [Angustibacter sp. McL0619]|uniref:2-hydroxyacid dehydrogenase n=1 Tax=Angustibacter sp. McL0619 TaxID=3415676 RepID=UPI003CED1101
MDQPWVVTLPEQDFVDAVGSPPDGVRVRLWDLSAPAERPEEISVVVPPYMEVGDWRPVLAALPNLRLVQTLTAGYESMLPLLPEGVALANAVGVHDSSTSELAVGLALAVLRGFPDFVRDAEHGRWAPQRRRALADRRVLVVGFGGVGRAVAGRMTAFEAQVTAVASRARAPRPEEAALGVQQVHGVGALADLLPQHDVVVLTVPLNDATRAMVDADFLAAMPDGAVLVNVARGGVVDTDALVAELNSGRLLAGLDVTEPEPLPEGHPLWSAPGVLISPHVGGATSAFTPRAGRMLREQLDRLSTGRPLRGIVVRGQFGDEFAGEARS